MVWLRNRWVLRATGIAAALLVWEVLGRGVGEALLAGPSLVLPELVDLVVDGEMPVALAGSLRQMLVGYALALAIGMPVGVAMGRSRLLDAVLRPWVNMLSDSGLEPSQPAPSGAVLRLPSPPGR